MNVFNPNDKHRLIPSAASAAQPPLPPSAKRSANSDERVKNLSGKLENTTPNISQARKSQKKITHNPENKLPEAIHPNRKKLSDEELGEQIASYLIDLHGVDAIRPYETILIRGYKTTLMNQFIVFYKKVGPETFRHAVEYDDDVFLKFPLELVQAYDRSDKTNTNNFEDRVHALREKIVKMHLNTLFDPQTLNSNLIYESPSTIEHLSDFYHEVGDHEFRFALGYAPDLLLKSPQALIRAYELRESKNIEDLDPIISLIRADAFNVLDEKMDELKDFLSGLSRKLKQNKLDRADNKELREEFFNFMIDFKDSMYKDPFKISGADFDSFTDYMREVDLDNDLEINTNEILNNFKNHLSTRLPQRRDKEFTSLERNAFNQLILHSQRNLGELPDYLNVDLLLIVANEMAANPVQFSRDASILFDDLVIKHERALIVDRISELPFSNYEEFIKLNCFDPSHALYEIYQGYIAALEDLFRHLSLDEKNSLPFFNNLPQEDSFDKMIVRTLFALASGHVNSEGQNEYYYLAKERSLLLGLLSGCVVNKKIILGSKFLKKGAAKKVSSSSSILDGNAMVKAQVKKREKIDGIRGERDLIQKLAAYNSPYLLPAYEASFELDDKYGNPKLVLYGEEFDGDGATLKGASVNQLRQTFADLTAGLSVLHRAGYVYGDLKIDNFLVSNYLHHNGLKGAILHDFDFSVEIGKKPVSWTGGFLPPETPYGTDTPMTPHFDEFVLFLMGIDLLWNDDSTLDYIYELSAATSQEAIDKTLKRFETAIRENSSIDNVTKLEKISFLNQLRPLSKFNPNERKSAEFMHSVFKDSVIN